MINLINQEYVIALFLLYLIISGNYVGDLFGCRLQEAFTELAYAKHLIAFFSLYYFVNLTTPGIQDPVKVLTKSVVMYLVFIVSRNVSFGYTIIFLLSMITIKFLEDYKEYHFKEDTDSKDDKQSVNKNRINTVQKSLVILVYGSIFVGFLRYTQNFYKTHKKFNWITYLLGKNRFSGCKSLKDNFTLKNVRWF